MRFDPVLERFSEGMINFNPTYKYDDNTDTYDTSKKQRVPSWTDRILYQASRGSNQAGEIKNSIRLEYYNRREHRHSDHRPVLAMFSLVVKKIDKSKKQAIEREQLAILMKAQQSEGIINDELLSQINLFGQA